MSERRLTVGELRGFVEDFADDADVTVRFDGTLPMPVQDAEVRRGRNNELELCLILPPNPVADEAVDFDFTRLCENMVRGESTTFQVRFGMDLMKRARAYTPAQRLEVLSKYFADAKKRVDDVIEFGNRAGRIAADEDE